MAKETEQNLIMTGEPSLELERGTVNMQPFVLNTRLDRIWDLE